MPAMVETPPEEGGLSNPEDRQVVRSRNEEGRSIHLEPLSGLRELRIQEAAQLVVLDAIGIDDVVDQLAWAND